MVKSSELVKELTKEDEIKIQEKRPNFRNSEGKLYLVRCFICDPNCGVENYMPAVATGQCAWCGWKETEDPTDV